MNGFYASYANCISSRHFEAHFLLMRVRLRVAYVEVVRLWFPHTSVFSVLWIEWWKLQTQTLPNGLILTCVRLFIGLGYSFRKKTKPNQDVHTNDATRQDAIVGAFALSPSPALLFRVPNQAIKALMHSAHENAKWKLKCWFWVRRSARFAKPLIHFAAH